MDDFLRVSQELVRKTVFLLVLLSVVHKIYQRCENVLPLTSSHTLAVSFLMKPFSRQ